MDERKKAGLRSGVLCSIGIPVVQFLSSTCIEFPLTIVMEWAFYCIPGVFAVHFGRHVIKDGKDAIVAILTASTVFSIIRTFIIAPYKSFSSGKGVFENGLPYFGLLIFSVFFMYFIYTTVLSIIGGSLYAECILGIPVREPVSPKTQDRPLKPVYCFQCGGKVEEDQVPCPHCGANLADDTRSH